MDSLYKEDLEIDKYSLDSECVGQPQKFMAWSEKMAEATAERDRADQNLEVVKAQVEQAVRKDPDAFGLDKVTEGSIKSAVTIHPEVQEANERWIQAKYNASILMSAKDAMEQRRSMLEILIKLFLSGYWADPKVPREDALTLSKDADRVQKVRLNRKRGSLLSS